MSLKNGVFGDSTGIRFTNPRPTSPYKTWNSDYEAGFKGLFIIYRRFFYFFYLINNFNEYRFNLIFDGPEKSIKTPDTPFCYRLGTAMAPAAATDTTINQENNNASSK